MVSLVSMSPWCRASCAKKFALRGAHDAETRKSSPSAGKMTQKWRFMACWANFFAEMPLEGACWANFFAPTGTAPVLDAARRTSGWLRWGFCSIRSWLPACRRRVTLLMTPFPRVVAVRSCLWLAQRPKCRPPRRKTLKMGCRGRGGLRFGHSGVCRGVLLVGEPIIRCAHPIYRT